MLSGQDLYLGILGILLLHAAWLCQCTEAITRMQLNDASIKAVLKYHALQRRPTHRERHDMSKASLTRLQELRNVTTRGGLAYRSTRDETGVHGVEAPHSGVPSE